jgi:hypothetical protein
MRNPCKSWKLLILPYLIGMVFLFAAPAAPAPPHISVEDIYSQDNYLCIDFRLRNAMEETILESMLNGVPALLQYEVGVWKNRSSWYDKLVRTKTFAYKMHYDNWDSVYCVSNLRDRTNERIGAGSKADLIHLVCNQQRMQVCPLGDLDALASYYITISAEIRSLSAERVREIDSWLGGGDESEEAGGGLLGFVIGIFTTKGKTAETRSWIFSPDSFRSEGIGG